MDRSPVQLHRMPGNTHAGRALAALIAIKATIEAEMAVEDSTAATVELYTAANGPAIPDFVRTVEVPQETLLSHLRATGFTPTGYRRPGPGAGPWGPLRVAACRIRRAGRS